MLPMYADIADVDPYAHCSYPDPFHLAFTHQTRRDSTPPDMLDYYPAAQPLFPTPSELLSNICHPQPHCDIIEHRPPPHTDHAATTHNAVNKTESQRKARQRAIAEEIGFTPTDPYVPSRSAVPFSHRARDTISSHEKKRHYLECLEQYVLYLHEQLRLVQTAPLTLERVSTYRGLSSRSIRTLLVHMQNTNKTLHEGTFVEEQVVRQTIPGRSPCVLIVAV